jgi:ESCRT-II complex subunit VPS36
LLILISRDLSGKNYFTELAKEVEQFAFGVLSKFGGVLALIDLYCMYNRARGTDLISPEDLLTACERLSAEPSSKIVLRTFTSGVKVIQNSNLLFK